MEEVIPESGMNLHARYSTSGSSLKQILPGLDGWWPSHCKSTSVITVNQRFLSLTHVQLMAQTCSSLTWYIKNLTGLLCMCIVCKFTLCIGFKRWIFIFLKVWNIFLTFLALFFFIYFIHCNVEKYVFVQICKICKIQMLFFDALLKNVFPS